MDVAVDAGQFELTAEQRAIQEMSQAFAAERVAPFALEWDKARHFPDDVIRATGELGFGGIYVGDEVGGSGLGRLDAVLIFEALAAACPAFSSFISIHNMAAWMIDRFGSDEQRKRLLPDITSMRTRELLPHGAGFRLGRRGAQDPRRARPGQWGRLHTQRRQAVHLRAPARPTSMW
jgi:alkylation response protein AidB-like acyl-CoA dehydrogenase